MHFVIYFVCEFDLSGAKRRFQQLFSHIEMITNPN